MENWRIRDLCSRELREAAFLWLQPRPSSYPLLGPKYLLLGTIYPQLRVQGGSFNVQVVELGLSFAAVSW